MPPRATMRPGGVVTMMRRRKPRDAMTANDGGAAQSRANVDALQERAS